MAKVMVKCPVCGQYFDRMSEPFVKEKRRYLHEACAQKKATVEKDKEDLYLYIQQLFDTQEVPVKVIQQINKLMKENKNYTYSGIFKSLYYFYTVKGNNVEKSNGGIGIVPYIYEEARNYYYNIWQANQKNSVKMLEQYKPKEVIIKIESPTREPHEKKMFSFLDEEESDEE